MKPWEMFGDQQDEQKPWEVFKSGGVPQFADVQKPAMEHQSYSQVRPVQELGNPKDFAVGVGSGLYDLLRGANQRIQEGRALFGAGNEAERKKLYEEEAARRYRRDFDPNVTLGEKVGHGVGMIGGTLPLAFAPGGQTAVGSTLMSLLAGGAAGAMLPTTSPLEALINTGTAGAGQAIGNLVGRTVMPTQARNMSQAQKDILDAASAENIPLRTSEATGSRVLKNWEQMRSNRPITGSMEERFNKAQTEAINRAFTRRLGNEMPEVNDVSLKTMRDSIGGEISGTVKGKNVPLDTDFLNSLAAVEADAGVGGKLTFSPQLRKTVDDAIDLIVNKPNVSGEVAQRIRSKLMDRARDARSADNTELANGLEDIVDGLKKAIQGTMSPNELRLWNEANRRYSNYKLVEEAFKKDPKSLAQGDVPINKMARVLEQNRPLSYVHGTGDFANLAKLGQAISPPGRSALLGETQTPIVRNAMDVVHGAAYPVIQSRLMQQYLTGNFPLQRLMRDAPGAAELNDSMLRALGLTYGLEQANPDQFR